MTKTIKIDLTARTHCEGCGEALASVGSPINDTYCPNKSCDWTERQMRASIRASIEAGERKEYERLKAKFG